MFKRKNKSRNIKKIFQWEEYLNWNNLSNNQKINFKRFCFFPILAYFVYSFLSQFTYAILIIFALYFFVRFKDRNKISK